MYITSEKPESFWSSEIIAVAQLRPSSGEGLSSRQSISKEELLGSLRTPINHIFSSSGNNYFLGDITVSTMKQQENKVISIIFNHERTAWHYGWTSSKWVQDATHVMDVVILEDKGGFSLDIIGSFVSNEFGITSTKKRRNDIKMESRKKEGVIKAKTGKSILNTTTVFH